MKLNNETNEVMYRQANEEDYPAVIDMYTKLDGFLRQFPYAFPEVQNVGLSWFETFRRTLGRFSVLFVAEYENDVVGFIIARVKRVPEYLGGVMVGELKDMWVKPKVRRLGIGEVLLRKAIEWCRTQDVHSVEAQILLGNEPILKVVEDLGMKRELYQLRMRWDEYREESSQP